MTRHKNDSKGVSIPVRLVLIALVSLSVLSLGATGMAAAQVDCDTEEECEEQLGDVFTDIGNFIVFIVVAIAVPNGAYGFLEWMTANDSVEKDDRGRKRIRNTFIALGGVGVLRIMVEMMKLFLPGIS